METAYKQVVQGSRIKDSRMNGPFNPLMRLVCAIAAVLLISFYVLPDTAWGRFSPLSHLPVYDVGTANFIGAACCCLFVLGVWLTFLPAAYTGGRLFSLWMLTGMWLGGMIITALSWRDNMLQADQAILLLGAVGIGLLTARLSGTSDRALSLLVPVAAVQAGYSLVYQHEHLNMLQSGTILRAGGTYNSVQALCTLTLLCLPLAVVCVFQSRQAAALLFWSFCTALLFAALLLTWYREAFVALTVSLTWLVWRLLKQRWTVLIVGAILVFLTLGIFAVRSAGERNAASAGRSVHGRMLLWRSGLTAFCQHPLTGAGLGALRLPVTVPTSVPGKWERDIEPEPKNLLLDWLGEMGLPGGVLLILMAFSVKKVVEPSRLNMAAGLGAAWIALGVTGVLDTPFGATQPHVSNALVGVLLGATLMLPGGRAEEPTPEETPNSPQVLSFPLISKE